MFSCFHQIDKVDCNFLYNFYENGICVYRCYTPRYRPLSEMIILYDNQLGFDSDDVLIISLIILY